MNIIKTYYTFQRWNNDDGVWWTSSLELGTLAEAQAWVEGKRKTYPDYKFQIVRVDIVTTMTVVESEASNGNV